MQMLGVHVQVAVLAAMLLQVGASTTERVRFCGGSLSQAVSMVCRSFNSPSWDQSGRPVRNRVKRESGIADECCTAGCTWNDLRLYCAVDEPSFPISDTIPESEELEHVIADRSVEAAAASEAFGEAPPRFDARFGHSEMRDYGASRSAPVVGTVSPLLVWGRSIQTDQPSRERLLYVTV